jgi:hypothetical protein
LPSIPLNFNKWHCTTSPEEAFNRTLQISIACNVLQPTLSIVPRFKILKICLRRAKAQKISSAVSIRGISTRCRMP